MAKPLLYSLLLVAAVFAVCAPVLQNGFVGYDDGEYVVDNPNVNTGITAENIIWAFTASHSNNWHPLTWISHMLDVSLFGLNPWGHHLTSLLLHIASTVLLFFWLQSVTAQPTPNIFIALVFGLHPLHVESVAWVAERKDVLSTLFWTLTLIAYSAWVRKPGLGRYLTICGCLIAGLLAKQMLVTVPVLLLILDRWPLQRTEPLRQRIVEKMPLVALSAIFSVIVILVQRASGAASTFQQLPLTLRLSNALLSYVRYLGKTLWPADLSVFYPFSIEIALWKPLAALALIAAISALVFKLRGSHPWLACGWLWYLLTLLPVIGIIQVGMQSMADRYMYVPMIGLLIAIAYEGLKPALAALAVLACAVVTWQQIPVWKDGVTLFSHALKIDNDNFVAHDNLGVELDRRGQFDEALAHYRETLRIKPGDRQGETNYAHALFAKAERLIAANKLDEAMAATREGLRYQPQNPLAHTLAGTILSQQRQLDAALKAFTTALDIDPGFAPAHMGTAVALSWAGRAAEARTAFETTLRHDPKNVEAHYGLGVALMALQRPPAEAREHFESALALNPKFAPAQAALKEIQ